MYIHIIYERANRQCTKEYLLPSFTSRILKDLNGVDRRSNLYSQLVRRFIAHSLIATNQYICIYKRNWRLTNLITKKIKSKLENHD